MATFDRTLSADAPSQPEARCHERHYSVAEIAETWNFGSDVVRKLFDGEPGVLVIGDNGTRSKRRYRTLRIPESVMQRVHRRLCNPDITQSRIDSRRPVRVAFRQSGPPIAANN